MYLRSTIYHFSMFMSSIFVLVSPSLLRFIHHSSSTLFIGRLSANHYYHQSLALSGYTLIGLSQIFKVATCQRINSQLHELKLRLLRLNPSWTSLRNSWQFFKNEKFLRKNITSKYIIKKAERKTKVSNNLVSEKQFPTSRIILHEDICCLMAALNVTKICI